MNIANKNISRASKQALTIVSILFFSVVYPIRNYVDQVVDALVAENATCSGVTCTVTITSSGDYVEWTRPAGVTSITFDLIGGSATGLYSNGGSGARVQGTLDVTNLPNLYFYIGGNAPTSGVASPSADYEPPGGWNGGGAGGAVKAAGRTYYHTGGGGASDIRTIAGAWDDPASLASRIVVAGGGGGGGSSRGNSSCPWGGTGFGGNGGYGIDDGGFVSPVNVTSGGHTLKVTLGSRQPGCDGYSGEGGRSNRGGTGLANNLTSDNGALGVGGSGERELLYDASTYWWFSGTYVGGGGGGGGGYFGGGGGDNGNASCSQNSGCFTTGGGGGASMVNTSYVSGDTYSTGSVPKVILTYSRAAVTSVDSATVNQTYGIGSTIAIRLTFSQAITTSGSMTLELETGTINRLATCAAVTASTTLMCSYTVQAGDTSGDLDYSSVTALSGTITSPALYSLDLPTPGATGSLSRNEAFVIDALGPTFVSAASDALGSTVTLTYSEPLLAWTALTSAFTVTANGTVKTIGSRSISGSTLTLNLNTYFERGDAVFVEYNAPTNDVLTSNNAIQDATGNDAASLSPTAVTNNSTADTRPPVFVSAATNTFGTTITLTYSEALSATTASASAFAVVVGGSSRGVSSAVVSGSTVVLTLASAVVAGQSVTVAYTDPSGSNDANAVQDSAGNDAASLSATSVTNNADSVPPSYVSAATNSAGDQVTLTFGEALSSTTAAAGAFSVVVNGTAVTPSSVTVSGPTVVLAVSPAIQRGDAVTFAYTDPTNGNDTNAVQDSIGNDVGSISITSVTNSSTVDTRTPTFVSAATSADGTTITLTYSEALSATTASASAFAVVVGGSSRGVSSAVVSGSTVVLTLASAVVAGQSVTVAYTDPSGSNDANAVQDSAGNDAASLSATSVTNNVPQPSSGGAAPTNGTTTSTSSTTTTTTIARVPASVTTTTTAPRRPRSTSTTVLNRTTTTIRATTTTTTTLTSIAPTSTTTSLTTTTIAPSTITYVASSAIQTLQQAEEKLKIVEAQTSAVTNDLRAAQIQVGESRVAVLDPKSALVVAVSVAEGRVARLSAAKASNAEIAAAVTQLEDLKIAIAQNVTISIEKIATAQAKLAAVLSDPSTSAKQLAEAKAELVSARVPTVEVVAAIINSVTTDAHLAPVVIPGVVDNAGSGQIVFLDGSIEKKVEIVRINGNAIRLTSTDGFTLNISTRDKAGQPLQFNSRGGIVVKHGNFISISGEGFAPGTLAKTWLFSSPRELGNLNVSTDGSFAAEFPITDEIQIGDHVAQVDGLSPDGEVRSLSLDVEILPSEGQAEYDPIAKRLAVAALIAQAMALLALSRRREDNEGDDDREQADVSEVSVDQVVGRVGTKSDVYSPPVIRSIDGLLQQIPSRIASTQQLLARIIRDGVYLRALTGVGGVAVAFSGVIVGFFASNSSGFDAVSPSFGWLLALVILGSLDALAGGMAALTIIAITAISGGIDSTDAIRGLLGLAVLSFAIPLVASTTRPFRRNSAKSENWLWTRTSDVVLLSLFGAWAAGVMYDALPGLYGFTSSAAGRTTTVQVVVLATLIVRFILEGVATKVTGYRLAYLAGPSFSEPSAGRSVFAIIVRTAIMLFVAEAFIGNNFALWIGAAMYAIPKLIELVAYRFPKSGKLKVWLPAGLLRTVVMLFVARWWASNISSFSEDPATQLQAAFVLLGIPSLVLTSLGWFAGGDRKWRSTPVSKGLGIMVLAIGVLTVRGVLFA